MSKEMYTKTITQPGARGGLQAWLVRCSALLCGLAVFAVAGAAAASAATATPAWFVFPYAVPTNFSAPDTSGNQHYAINIINQGGAAASGAITITDTLPAGITLNGYTAVDGAHNTVTCSAAAPNAQNQTVVTCTDPDTSAVEPSEEIAIKLGLSLAAGTASGSDSVTVSGGGASAATATAPTTISSSTPAPGIETFQNLASDDTGAADTQAGSHPYDFTTAFALNTAWGTSPTNGAPSVVPDDNLKDVQVQLPAGLVGSATAAPQCPTDQLAGIYGDCPADTQVGTIILDLNSGNTVDAQQVPVYNMVPPPGMPAEFGFSFLNVPNLIQTSVRTGSDYGITATLSNISQSQVIQGSLLTLWGNPMDASHTSLRGSNGSFGIADGATPTAFMTMPTSCGSSLSTSLSVDFWGDPGQYTAPVTSSQPGLTGCSSLDFSPSLSVQPDTSVADSPSGLSVDLSFPQTGLTNPSDTAEANLQNATITLPQGVTIDPSAATGLTGCSPDQIGIKNANAPTCPDDSKVGTVRIDSPLLADQLTGNVYLAQQDNNPFNSLVAIYATAYADGVWVKLAGQITLNPVTGQLQTTFSDNPQLPFSSLDLDFFGGSQGVLATPEQCGTYSTTSDLSPWSGGSDASPSDSFDVSNGCVSGFDPSFTAGSQIAQAGAFSPFVMSLQRQDTDQNLSGLSVTLPPGLLAKLAGVPECSDAQLAVAAAGSGAAEQASPSCPASSQVGTVTAGSGVGPDPFFLSGQVYLTGPYKGAPYGLAIVVPAVAGPYDLGTVVVRQALEIDPTTAQVTDVSDPFPTILDGIPLDIKRIDVDLNRPGFTVNPTSCDPMSVTAALTSIGGLSENVSSRFQVGGCQALPFSPKLKLALSGKGKTRSGDHPTLAATLTDPSGQANIHSAKVTLPLSLALDPNNSEHVCNYQLAQAVHGGAVGCPASTVVGKATVTTPLLSEPLSGAVYLVQGIRFSHGQAIHTLPSLLIPLRGQIALDLRAQTSVSGGKLVTTFSTIPDAPVSKFTLQITGGRKGLLVITGRGKTICGKAQVSNATLGAQSGKRESMSVTMAKPCTKAKKPKKPKKTKTSKRSKAK